MRVIDIEYAHVVQLGERWALTDMHCPKCRANAVYRQQFIDEPDYIGGVCVCVDCGVEFSVDVDTNHAARLQRLRAAVEALDGSAA